MCGAPPSGPTAPSPARNRRIVQAFREVADLLEDQDANPFRVSAYRRAAESLEHLDRDLVEVLDRDGFAGLTALPHVGLGLAGAIREMVVTGRWGQLERLRGTADPVRLFERLPGVGPALAQRLHDALEVESLEALEVAAHEGRLERVPGVGPRRAAQIRNALAALLSRRPRAAEPATTAPPVDLLLDVDREYRARAAAGTLPVLAPRRFNPERKAWLPVLHTERDAWHFTALFSNTSRAHELGKTDDWVVLYVYDGHGREMQQTVVTETRGALAGRRVVRGREAECRDLRPADGETRRMTWNS